MMMECQSPPSNALELASNNESLDRVLQVSSGNLGLDNVHAAASVPKPTSNKPPRTSITVENNRNQILGEVSIPKDKKGRRQTDNRKCHDKSLVGFRCPILTKAELRSPRYLAYREKQRQYKMKGSKTEQVWSDELEEVFQDALRIYVNQGRKKTFENGRQWGGNERISELIRQRTGKIRCRKQVSSHLQVLKGFLRDNDEWMALVTCKNNKNDDTGQPISKSESPDYSDVRGIPVSHGLPPAGVLGSTQAHYIRRINFEMYILGPELEKLHVYTSLQSEIGSTSKNLDEIPHWQMLYPQLASCYDKCQSIGEIILFETSFRLMDNHPPVKLVEKQPALRSKLGVDFTVDINQGAAYSRWQCQSSFYEKGLLKESLMTPTSFDPLPSGEARIVVLHSSQWWVNCFTKIIDERLQREQEGDLLAVEEAAERARRHIRDITVIQEIWATTETDGSSPKRLAIFLWNFQQAHDHEAAITTWRKLIPPAMKTESFSPPQILAPTFVQPPMAIDTSRPHDLSQPTPLYAEYFSPSTFFAENSEKVLSGLDSRLSSPSLNLPPTSQSFPSSTSNSYPCSISDSILPAEVAHNSSYSSQGSIYRPHDSAYPLHEIGVESQEPMYSTQQYVYSSENLHPRLSQDVAYDPHGSFESQESGYVPSDYYYQSQDTTFQPQDITYHASMPQCQADDHRYQSPTDHAISPHVEDFSNMHIQISLGEIEDPHPAYNPSYVPPLETVTPPHDIHASSDFGHHSSETVHAAQPSQHQEPFDLDQWQSMDQAVQWASTQFSAGDFEHVGELLQNGRQVQGEIGELDPGMNVEMNYQRRD